MPACRYVLIPGGGVYMLVTMEMWHVSAHDVCIRVPVRIGYEGDGQGSGVTSGMI